MPYDQTTLDQIVSVVTSDVTKQKITDYFSVDNAKRQSVFAILTADMDRAGYTFNRECGETILKGWDVCFYHDNDILDDGQDPPRTDFLPWTSGQNMWSAPEFLKYIWLKGDQTDYWGGVKVCHVGGGQGHISCLLAELGADVTVYEYAGESLMIIAYNLIHHNVDALIDTSEMLSSAPDLTHDVYVFANVFYREEFCANNVPLVRAIAATGKEVLVSNPLGEQFYDNTDFLKFSPDEYDIVLDMPFKTDPEDFGGRQVLRIK